jgi:hypothetical protein
LRILTADRAQMKSKGETRSMRQRSRVRDIRRVTRRQYAAKEKVCIVITGLSGWSKEFLEAGKKRLVGDQTHEATSDEVRAARGDSPTQGAFGSAADGEPSVKKSVLGDGESDT